MRKVQSSAREFTYREGDGRGVSSGEMPPVSRLFFPNERLRRHRNCLHAPVHSGLQQTED